MVLQILRDAGLRVRQDFHLDGPLLPYPPVSFILHVGISCEMAGQIHDIPDVTLVRS